MKELSDKIQKNIVIYIEVFIYAVMLAVNIFFAFEIYAKVIEKVAPSAKTVELEISSLNSLNEDLLNVFKEDHQERKTYIESGDGTFENKWQTLSNPRSPF